MVDLLPFPPPGIKLGVTQVAKMKQPLLKKKHWPYNIKFCINQVKTIRFILPLLNYFAVIPLVCLLCQDHPVFGKTTRKLHSIRGIFLQSFSPFLITQLKQVLNTSLNTMVLTYSLGEERPQKGNNNTLPKCNCSIFMYYVKWRCKRYVPITSKEKTLH